MIDITTIETSARIKKKKKKARHSDGNADAPSRRVNILPCSTKYVQSESKVSRELI